MRTRFRQYLSKAIYAACFLLIALLLVPAIWLDTTHYQSLLEFVTQQLQRPDLLPLFRDRLFTASRYQMLYNLHFVLYAMVPFLWWLLYNKRKRLQQFVQQSLSFISRKCKSLFRFYYTLPAAEKWMLVLLSLAYFIVVYSKIVGRDITYDEAWNYNYFISRPVYFPFLLFNTYPFYHFVAAVLHYLPVNAIVLCRSIGAISGWWLLLLVFYVFSKGFTKRIAALLVILVMACPVFMLYTAMAKGIILSLVFCLGCFYAFLHLWQQFNRGYFGLFLMTGLFSIITMPTALLFVVAQILILFFQKILLHQAKYAMRIAGYSVLIISVCALFYLPAIFSLYSLAITSNFVFSQSHPLLNFYQTTSQILFGNTYLFAVLILLAIVLLFAKNMQRILLPSVLVVAVVTIMIFFRQFPDRSLAFVLLPLLVISGVLFQRLAEISLVRRLNIAILSFALFLSCVVQLKQAKSFIHPSEEDAGFSKRISQRMLQHQVATCYAQHPQFWVHFPLVEFYYGQQNKIWTVSNGNQNSARYRLYDPAVVYDCIVTDSMHQHLPGSNYKMLWQEQGFYFFVKY